jgi:hypothetical protein
MIAIWEVVFGNVNSVKVVAKNVEEAIRKARKANRRLLTALPCEDMAIREVKRVLEAQE